MWTGYYRERRDVAELVAALREALRLIDDPWVLFAGKVELIEIVRKALSHAPGREAKA